ncbi:MAG: acetyl-CoA hydrolase/transferase C-terminal domain-containing protein [Bacteriovorax sp.]|nr:acetyl-CoA hydrolase/transferase C-terminal domain-containing protein [Bacteriovorax sp.]
MLKYVSADEAVREIKSNDKVFIHSAAATPEELVKAMVRRSSELRDVDIYHIHTEGDCSYAKDEYRESFKLHAFFNGSNIRQATNNHLASSYVPIFLSDIPHLFYNKKVELDVALVQLTPPDRHGMCSLGPSVDVSIAALNTTKKIIAQINPKLPRTFGEQIHYSKITKAIYHEAPLYESPETINSPVELAIGKNIAELIEDGSTLQLGIGAIPNAVLSLLGNHKDLGIHTEMFSDGIISLYEKGAITGRCKKKHPRKIVSSFVIGSEKIYNFIDDNTEVILLDCSYTNNPHIIAQNPKVVAVNSAIEIDLTGQVCSDSIGSRIYSGVGGQMDFIRGAAISQGGKPIIALPSKTSKGESKIVPFLKAGAGVVTTRAHVQYVVTEYGVAYLHGLTLEERAKALIAIAAPEHRETLDRKFYELWL